MNGWRPMSEVPTTERFVALWAPKSMGMGYEDRVLVYEKRKYCFFTTGDIPRDWDDLCMYCSHWQGVDPPVTDHEHPLSPSGGELQATPVAVPQNPSEPVPGLSKEDV